MEIEMETEMEIAVSPTRKESGNYSDESTTTSSDSSGGTGGGSFSPLLKRLHKAKASMDTIMITDDDSDGKTSSTRSNISEEFGEPQAAAVGEEIGKRRCTTIEEYVTNNYSCPQDSQSEIETWRVDRSRLYTYAWEALKYYEEMTGKDYFYMGPRSMCLCSLPDSEYKITHINFFARHPRESESLFFAAILHGPVRKVLECCIVPLFKAGDGVVPCIKHSVDVNCSACLEFGDATLCFEDEEDPCCMTWSSWSSV